MTSSFSIWRALACGGLFLFVPGDGFAPARAAEAANEGPILLDEPTETPAATVTNEGKFPTQKYEDGTPRIEREVRKYSDNRIVNHGKFVEYYHNKKKFSEGTFDSGVQDGEWTFWYDNGQLVKKVVFARGKPNGAWEIFGRDGKLSAKHEYKNGKREGTWTSYYDDGKTVKIEAIYVNNALNGVRKTFFENGKPHQQAGFKDGVLNGLMEEWDETGKKVGEADFKEGMLDGELIRWGADGTKFEQSYHANQLVPKDGGAVVDVAPTDKVPNAAEGIKTINK